jgi:hypothetical protein
MTPFVGKLSKDGRVIADRIEGQVAEATGFIKSWYGNFSLPAGCSLQQNDSCRLDIEGVVSINIKIELLNANLVPGAPRPVLRFNSVGEPLE